MLALQGHGWVGTLTHAGWAAPGWQRRGGTGTESLCLRRAGGLRSYLAWGRVGCEGEGPPVGMVLPGSESRGLQSGATGSLGGGQRVEELCWGDSPMGKVLGGKTGAFATKLCGDFEGWGCKLSCGFD